MRGRSLANGIAKATTSPPVAGIGAPATIFVGTVIGTAPLRVQTQSGIDLPAIAPVGQALAVSDDVLVVGSGSLYFAFEIP